MWIFEILNVVYKSIAQMMIHVSTVSITGHSDPTGPSKSDPKHACMIIYCTYTHRSNEHRRTHAYTKHIVHTKHVSDPRDCVLGADVSRGPDGLCVEYMGAGIRIELPSWVGARDFCTGCRALGLCSILGVGSPGLTWVPDPGD